MGVKQVRSGKAGLGFYILQAIWQIVFVLTLTAWRGVTVIPSSNAEEILDAERWEWLIAAPPSGIRYPNLVTNFVQLLAL